MNRIVGHEIEIRYKLPSLELDGFNQCLISLAPL